MFLKWVATKGLLAPFEGSDPLAQFDPESRKRVCQLLVSDVACSLPRLGGASSTEPQLVWLLAVLGHALTLPVEKAGSPNTETMRSALAM